MTKAISLLAFGLWMTVSIGRGQQPLLIETPNLPNGFQGGRYSGQLNAKGGTTYEWAVGKDQLPAGLVLDRLTGRLTGRLARRPKRPGTYTFTITVTSPNRVAASKQFSIKIGNPLVLSTKSLGDGKTHAGFAETLQASGGSGAGYQWSIQEGLPPGIQLSRETGALSGTPTQAGVFRFSVELWDKLATGAASIKRPLTITIVDPLAITAPDLAVGLVSVSYKPAQITATGGYPPYSFLQPKPADLPGGLKFEHSTIAGTPTEHGSKIFTIEVQDRKGQGSSRQATINIYYPLVLSTKPLKDGQTHAEFAETIKASGGSGTGYHWHIEQGLPLGIQLNPETGALSGTPTQAGVFQFNVELKDKLATGAPSITQQLTITIINPLAVVVPTLAGGVVSVPYKPVQITATGGYPPYTFPQPRPADLPRGLKFEHSTIAGTPMEPDSKKFKIEVTDLKNQSNSQDATISIVRGEPFNELPGALSKSLTDVEEASDWRALQRGIDELTRQLLKEPLPSVPLCYDARESDSNAIQPSERLTRVRDEIQKLRTTKDAGMAASIDQCVGALNARIGLIDSSKQKACAGAWVGECRADNDLKMTATLESLQQGAGQWQWSVNEPDSVAESVAATGKMSDGQWTFTMGSRAEAIGRFEYDAQDDVRKFLGTLTIKAVRPLTFKCSLNGVNWKEAK